MVQRPTRRTRFVPTTRTHELCATTDFYENEICLRQEKRHAASLSHQAGEGVSWNGCGQAIRHLLTAAQLCDFLRVLE
jgi:hypothetical protein